MNNQDRLALIRKTSKKFTKKLKRNQRVRKTETSTYKVRDYSVNSNGISSSFIDNDYDNINQWTDAPKYVDEYYGDRARAQEQYEREWD
jgi:hypothetical protein